jgi:hypothetical protein
MAVIVMVLVIVVINYKKVFIMEINFEEMQVYDFNNLNLQEKANNNCYSCNGDISKCDVNNYIYDCHSCDGCDCDSW